MRYDSPGQILTAVQQMQLGTQTLQKNRVVINSLFNGDTPYTDDQAQAENIQTNVNFLEATRIANNAVQQLNNAFFKPGRFFKVNVCEGGIAVERQRAGDIITKLIAKEMRKSRPYRCARIASNMQVVLHGPGPVVWRNRRSPLPTTCGIEDVLIPQGTTYDMANLDMFAIYRELSWGQLEEAAFGPASDKGWNKPYVTEILKTLYKSGLAPIYQGNRWLFPEKIAEDYKEGAVQAATAAMPKALAWDFFFRDEDSGKWNRRMVIDYASIVSGFKLRNEKDLPGQQVMYKRNDYADDWQEIIHWYSGNCGNVAPVRFHSIRSMGYLLYGVCMLNNKMRCRMSDHTFQQLLTWFQNVSEDNREQVNLIDLNNFGILPSGVSMVGANERHTADWNLIMGSLNANRQLMAESSSAFLPDMQKAMGDSGPQMSATEAVIRQNTSVTMTSAVLGQLSDDSYFEYCEIARRFAMKGNPDPMAVRFREYLKEEGIPDKFLDYDAWEVVPEMTVGGGNKASELNVTQALMQEMYPLVDPNAQRLILRRRYVALTDNPDEALEVIPEAPGAGMQDDAQYAQVAGAVLMMGQPWQDKEGTNHVVMATVLMGVAQQALQEAQGLIEQPEGVAIAAQNVQGAANVLAHVQQEVQKVAQSPLLKQAAKGLAQQWQQLQGALQQIGKAVMAAEQEKSQQMGGSPEQQKAMVKIQEMQATAQTQRQIAAQSAEQKMQQKQAAWQQENERRNADTAAGIHRTGAQTMADIHKQMITAQTEARLKVLQAENEPAETS